MAALRVTEFFKTHDENSAVAAVAHSLNTWPVFCARGKSLSRHFFLRTTSASTGGLGGLESPSGAQDPWLSRCSPWLNRLKLAQWILMASAHLPKKARQGSSGSKAWSIQNMVNEEVPFRDAVISFMSGLIPWKLFVFIPAPC